MDSLNLGYLVGQLGGTVRGAPETQIFRLAPLSDARQGDLSFLSHPKYANQLTIIESFNVIRL